MVASNRGGGPWDPEINTNMAKLCGTICHSLIEERKRRLSTMAWIADMAELRQQRQVAQSTASLKRREARKGNQQIAHKSIRRDRRSTKSIGEMLRNANIPMKRLPKRSIAPISLTRYQLRQLNRSSVSQNAVTRDEPWTYGTFISNEAKARLRIASDGYSLTANLL